MNIYKYIILVCTIALVISCDKDELDEVPLEFLSPENSYTNSTDIETALVANYGILRELHNGVNNNIMHNGTDLCMSARNPETSGFGDYRVELSPSTGAVLEFWKLYYKIIANSNVILGRIDAIDYLDESVKDIHVAEARWFRGYAYRCLGYLYGGVPIILEEVSGPKRDFLRASKEETLSQAISDMEFAASNLPDISSISAEGKLNSAAAYHFLAELYIATDNYVEAISAANKVIDNSAISLMTSRFGSKASEEGDPYWDLFQRNNQNRNIGNTESILVLQEEFNIQGGTPIAQWESSTPFKYERYYGCLYWFLNDPDGEKIFFGPSTQNGGRPVGFVRPTPYFTHTIWGNGNWDVDLRNNNRNITRDWIVDNPSSSYFGQNISDFPQSWFNGLSAQDTLRDFYPNVAKISTPNDHPSELLLDESTGRMANSSGQTVTDWYLIRVAETYLLRAEAYLGQENTIAAAADINVVRSRSQAIPVVPGDVDINYILDERMRELNYEEDRRLTLARLGLVYDRTVLGNPFAGTTIEAFNNLFPIPFSEIQLNTELELEQNSGYVN
ncbi:RagB/SusD family nutrient uptake outer membrane protein [Seonamhaeicola algicola]|uniref:RagB/SusD family nutrient uptake outer membrane protein n=1 Tax=Seonamhaeicola algicola TaxID=1719036 RepID=A0A5C7AEK3_9FLAO|nr:RagB/SusD family nutrient uptake outer membrane protein [Seonamhaeicola algicola]TXE07240.1 RagB/SusD family nutrient uptake outer membrane protein [Seonamhaeicola algicola]